MKNINNDPCEDCSGQHCQRCGFAKGKSYVDHKRMHSEKDHPDLEGDRLDPIAPDDGWYEWDDQLADELNIEWYDVQANPPDQRFPFPENG